MKNENKEFEKCLRETGEVGRIIKRSGSIVLVKGLPSLRLKETVITESGSKGMVYGVGDVSQILMFDDREVETGSGIARTGELFSIDVSEEILGRVVNPLCHSLDKLGPVGGEKEKVRIEREAPGIVNRVEINRPLETGVSIVDLMVPLGYGQRETIIGDAKTGKTTFLLQTISSQAKKGVICVYVGIGKEISSIKEVEDYLKEMEVFDKVTIVATTSNQPPTIHYLAPYSGTAIAEYFRDKGNDVLIIFDDLSNHAKAYREISLLLKTPPGREAYPGDVFHLHASFIERAGNISLEDGREVSITALPVVETLENDISGFIQTNLLSMTDGHIFFDINEMRKGRIPPISTSLSVSRAGKQTRSDIDKEMAEKIRDKIVDYKKILEVSQFGAELSEENRKSLDFGKKLMVLFKQDSKRLISRNNQLILFGLLFTGFWKDVPERTMENELEIILDALESEKIIDFKTLQERIEKMENAEKLKDFCEDLTPHFKKLV